MIDRATKIQAGKLGVDIVTLPRYEESNPMAIFLATALIASKVMQTAGLDINDAKVFFLECLESVYEGRVAFPDIGSKNIKRG